MSAGKTFDNFEDLITATGEYVTQVCGVSMHPMLRNMRDPVLIHRATEELKPYDIAVYGNSGRYVVHRVLEVRDDLYVIRGDNCLYKEYVPKTAVVGVVVGFWRFGRYIPTDNKVYLFYAHLWVAVNPLIWLYRRMKGKVHSVCRLIRQ